MPRVKKLIIDYDQKTVTLELIKDSHLPVGAHYTPFQHFPLLSAHQDFLNLSARQKETDDWTKLRQDIASINKDLHLVTCLCNTHQLCYESVNLDVTRVTYTFDFGKTVEQKYGA